MNKQHIADCQGRSNTSPQSLCFLAEKSFDYQPPPLGKKKKLPLSSTLLLTPASFRKARVMEKGRWKACSVSSQVGFKFQNKQELIFGDPKSWSLSGGSFHLFLPCHLGALSKGYSFRTGQSEKTEADSRSGTDQGPSPIFLEVLGCMNLEWVNDEWKWLFSQVDE